MTHVPPYAGIWHSRPQDMWIIWFIQTEEKDSLLAKILLHIPFRSFKTLLFMGFRWKCVIFWSNYIYTPKINTKRKKGCCAMIHAGFTKTSKKRKVHKQMTTGFKREKSILSSREQWVISANTTWKSKWNISSPPISAEEPLQVTRTRPWRQVTNIKTSVTMSIIITRHFQSTTISCYQQQ